MTTCLHGLMRRKRNLFVGAALGLLIALTGNPAIAQEVSETSPQGGAGLQAASWLATIPYGTVKVVYSLVGGIVGGRLGL